MNAPTPRAVQAADQLDRIEAGVAELVDQARTYSLPDGLAEAIGRGHGMHDYRTLAGGYDQYMLQTRPIPGQQPGIELTIFGPAHKIERQWVLYGESRPS